MRHAGFLAAIAGVTGILVCLFSAGNAAAEPTHSANSTSHTLTCDDGPVAIMHTPGGSGPSWTVEPDGRADMNHARWIDVRGYEGDFADEPDSAPTFHARQRFGNRWGQGPGRHCSLRDHIVVDGHTFTLFADAEIVTRAR